MHKVLTMLTLALLTTLSASGEASLKINDGRYAVFPKMFVTLQARTI